MDGPPRKVEAPEGLPPGCVAKGHDTMVHHRKSSGKNYLQLQLGFERILKPVFFDVLPESFPPRFKNA